MKPLLSFHLLALAAALLTLDTSSSSAQEKPPVPFGTPAKPIIPATGAPKGLITVQFPNSPINEVLEAYQQLTGKRIIRDPRLENASVTIETSGELPKDEAIEFIEKSLLLSGYAIVPSGENMIKVLAVEQGKIPSSEGVEMILDAAKLPKSDKVVSFVLPLEYLKSDEAAQAFSQIIPPHAYGKMVAVPNSRALVITENSNTIRSYIELTKQVDVPPSETTHKSIHLERADAEETAQILSAMLGLDQASGSKSSSPKASNPVAQQQQRPPGSPPPVAGAQAVNAVYSTSGGNATAEATPPKITAIPRTNALLVIARPVDIAYIESIVAELDAESTSRSFISRTLKFMDPVDFVNIAKDALLRGVSDKSGSGSALQGNQTTTTTTPTGSNQSSRGGFGQSGFGGGSNGGFGSSLGGGGGSGFDSGSSLQEENMPKPQSMLIGKTLVIVDSPNQTFYASGPPEQLRILTELVDQIDKRPQQILLSAVVGELTLGDDFKFGLDWIRTLEKVGNDNFLGGVIKTSTDGTIATRDLSTLGSVKDYLPALQGFTFYGKIGKNVNTFLNTLEATKKFKVMQRPTLTTVNHKLATISIGQQVPIAGQTQSFGTTTGTNNGLITSTQYIPVQLKLSIIPHIYDGKEIKLQFQQQNNDISSYTTIGGNQAPNISTQELNNTIIVPDGSTVLLGGLIKESDQSDKSGLPLLVRIPVIKYLFGSTTKGKNRRELMIFVQPRILSQENSLVNETREMEKTSRFHGEARQLLETGDSTVNPLLPLPTYDEAPKAQPVQTSGEAMPKVILKNKTR
jgi:type II secretion system protein D